MRILFLIIFLATIQTAHAQFWKKKRDSNERNEQRAAPNSLSPNSFNSYYPEQKKESRARAKKKASLGKTTYNAEREYYERVEAVAKTRRKNERLSLKPQYSDPSYFGHKRPPKKNPPHKMKFCKECGIRH